MIQSMTGFGKATVAYKEKKINVEVNRRRGRDADDWLSFTVRISSRRSPPSR